MRDKKKKSKLNDQENHQPENEGIVGMLISMHTFPIESEEELMNKQKLIEELKNNNNIKNDNA